MAREVEDFAECFCYGSSFTQGFVRSHPNAGLVLSSHRSVRDVGQDSRRTFFEVHTEGSPEEKSLRTVSTVETIPTDIYDISASGEKSIAIRSNTKAATAVTTIDLIYNTPNDCQQPVSGSVRVDVSHIHGKVIADTWFGGCSWSSNERYFSYVAQPLPVTSTSLIDEAVPATGKVDVKKADNQGDHRPDAKYMYKEDWGEKYVGLHSLVICLFDTQTGLVTTVPTITPSEQYCVGQPVLVSSNGGSGLQLVYTAWSTLPRRLGMIYCYQRPCALYVVNLTAYLEDNTSSPKSECITPTLPMARSARVYTPSCIGANTVIAFLGRSVPMTSHNGCIQLFSVAISAEDVSSPVPLTPIISIPSSLPTDSTSMSFPGIFCDQLPRRCFVGSGADVSVVLNTSWGSHDAVISVPLSSTDTCPQIHRLLLDNKAVCGTSTSGSCSVLDVHQDTGALLFVSSSPSQPMALGLAVSVQNNAYQSVFAASRESNFGSPFSVWAKQTQVRSNVDAPVNLTHTNQTTLSLVSQVQSHVCNFVGSDGVPFQAILLLPPSVGGDGDGNAKSPVIVVPHGGPHSVLSTAFLTPYTFLCLSTKYAILLVNYRGSIGFGEQSVRSLLGTIGTNDVADVVEATEFAIHTHALDSDRVGICGGSHGGFLGAHCIGQHPKLFKVACLRNPVTNIPSMVTTSDIPDWCMVESSGCDAYQFDTFKPPTASQYHSLYQCSPIRYLSRVVAPTLILLGAMDRRVPDSQGKEYYHSLRAQGCVTSLMVFPEDTHAIDKPASEADHWIAISKWFNKYL